jgi:hypothetical protein
MKKQILSEINRLREIIGLKVISEGVITEFETNPATREYATRAIENLLGRTRAELSDDVIKKYFEDMTAHSPEFKTHAETTLNKVGTDVDKVAAEVDSFFSSGAQLDTFLNELWGSSAMLYQRLSGEVTKKGLGNNFDKYYEMYEKFGKDAYQRKIKDALTKGWITTDSKAAKDLLINYEPTGVDPRGTITIEKEAAALKTKTEKNVRGFAKSLETTYPNLFAKKWWGKYINDERFMDIVNRAVSDLENKSEQEARDMISKEFGQAEMELSVKDDLNPAIEKERNALLEKLNSAKEMFVKRDKITGVVKPGGSLLKVGVDMTKAFAGILLIRYSFNPMIFSNITKYS